MCVSTFLSKHVILSDFVPELHSLAQSPTVVRGPHGVDVNLDSFVEAYEEYHKLQGTLNSTLKVHVRVS